MWTGTSSPGLTSWRKRFGSGWGRLGMRYRFSDITINFDSKRVPLSAKQREEHEGKYPYYGAQGIIDYIDDYIFDGKYLLIAEDGENLKSKKQKIAQLANGRYWVNNHAHIVQTNEKCLIEYLYYVFNITDISGYITGSAQPKLSQANLNAIEFEIPPIQQQKRIVAVLSTLDSKIELNQKISKNLERQAQAIFQLRFTDEQETNGYLADICQYSKEKVTVSSLDLDSYYSTENMLPGKAGATQAANLPTTTQTTKCNAGDVLVSNIRPYFKKIVYCYTDCGCSTDVLCFVPKKQELSAYLFFLLYTDAFFDFMVAGSKGTKMPRGDKQQIMMYPVCVPSDEELMEFNNVARPILKQIRLNREENKRLITLRDTLLPRLISGEIDILNTQISR